MLNIYVVMMTLVIGFLITVLLSPIFIPFLRKLKFGQSIREEGPESHMKKSGTPTMGGIMIIFSIVATFIIIAVRFIDVPLSYEFWLLLFVLIGYGGLGFLDDFIKVALKRNLGLTSRQKLIGQLFIAIILYITLQMYGFPTNLSIPLTDASFALGWAYGLLLIFMLVGASNAVNLTAGLAGLLAGTATVAFGAFAIIE